MRQNFLKRWIGLSIAVCLVLVFGFSVQPRSVAASQSVAPDHANLLVVCVEFAGQPARKPLSLYQQLYFGATHSVAAYYRQVSYGRFLLTGTVIGNPLRPGTFLQLPHPEAYYAKNDNGSGGGYPRNDDGIVAAVIYQLVQDHFDFSPYVSAGSIPYLAIVFSGYGADADPLNPDLVWPVETNLHNSISVPVTTNGNHSTATVSAYDLVPELDDASNAPVTLGVVTHEFGHLLGLMDLYDVSGAANTGQGIGPFSLMGTGNWNGFPDGTEPAGLDPFSLQYLGWVVPTPITESETGVPLPPLEQEPVVYQLIPLHNHSEYFLVSNEENLGVDAALPDQGVFIWRIDARNVLPISYDWSNDVLDSPSQNRSHHYDIALVSAGNTNDLTQPEDQVTYYDDAYPSRLGNRTFTPSSKPANLLWSGRYLGLNITRIVIDPANKWATFDVVDSQSGSSLAIKRPSSGLSVKVGTPIALQAEYTSHGITTNVAHDASWSSPNQVEWQGAKAVFIVPGQAVVNVTYHDLSARAYFNVQKN